MGCWDIYCFLCGNPARRIGNNYDKIILKDIILEGVPFYKDVINGKTTMKNKKRIIDLYKQMYEIYKNDKEFIEKFIILWNNTYLFYEYNKEFPEKFINLYKKTYEKFKNINELIKNFEKLNKTTKWVEKCTFLTTDNKIIHNCKIGDDDNFFTDSKNNNYNNIMEYADIWEESYGVFVHTDCWKYVKNKFNINLNYSYLPILNSIKNPGYKIFNFINYGTIEKYWRQDFNFIKVLIDSNEHLVTSPLVENSLTSLFINKIFSKLKIRLDSERKGPITSAGFYNNGTYKIGLNGNFWQIKSGKWIEIKEPVSKIIKIINRKDGTKFIRQLKFIGEYNNIPLFVQSIKHEKQNSTFELICIESYLPILNKKIK
jgi:hypothetical protein